MRSGHVYVSPGGWVIRDCKPSSLMFTSRRKLIHVRCFFGRAFVQDQSDTGANAAMPSLMPARRSAIEFLTRYSEILYGRLDGHIFSFDLF